jgi:hypothetical protein
MGRVLIPRSELDRILTLAQPYDPKPKPKPEAKLDAEPKPQTKKGRGIRKALGR